MTKSCDGAAQCATAMFLELTSLMAAHADAMPRSSRTAFAALVAAEALAALARAAASDSFASDRVRGAAFAAARQAGEALAKHHVDAIR